MAATLEDLAAVERLVAGLEAGARAELVALAEGELAERWGPLPGPQTLACESEADVLLFGGAGGGGKSDTLLGLALTRHRRSLVMRRHYTDLSFLTERALEIQGGRSGFNASSPPTLRTADGRLVEFGAAQYAGDVERWQGRPHDFLGIDEAAQFLESQVRYLMGWVRSTEPGQRTRVVLATNPPLSDDGNWLVAMFAPWLDPAHPEPAKPGELRWFIADRDGADRAVAGPGMYDDGGGRQVAATSRTFIPARLSDNPFLAETGYGATLDALPEPLRSSVRDGNFMAARRDDEWQVVPSAWVRAAQQRWAPDGLAGLAMTAIGVDVAQGGDDQTILAPRYGAWFAPLIARAGRDTPDAPTVAGLIATQRRDGAGIVVDVGGGYGGGVVSWLKENLIDCAPFNGANGSARRSADGALGFVNKRAEAWWRLREALDPAQPGGSPLALPADSQLAADLAAPRWKLTPRGIQVEAKDEIRARLGRSPDRGDAVVMAWSEGEALAVKKSRTGAAAPKVVLGYAGLKGRRR